MANADRIRKLVEALRSDKYKQGRQRLRMNDNFCCLGVACDVYKNETGDGEWENIGPVPELAGGDGFKFRAAGDCNEKVLPQTVADWYAFGDNNGDVGFNPIVPTLGNSMARLNDWGASFAAIAQGLEESFLTTKP